MTPSQFMVSTVDDSGTGSLRQAVLDANANPGQDTIVFDSTTFAASQIITLTTGELGVMGSVIINGPGASLVTVSGNNTSRVFKLFSAYPAMQSTTITGLTISNASGHGILNDYNNLTIDACVISNNHVSSPGGGGIRVLNGGSLTLRNSLVTGNTSTVAGGGIYLTSFGSFLVENSAITNNTGRDGGGFALAAPAGSAGWIIRNSTVSGNSAIGITGAGGGVITTGVGSLTAQNSTFTANSANGNGGGISTITSLAIIMESTIVSGNTAGTNANISTPGKVSAKNSAIGNGNFMGTFDNQGGNLAFGTALNLGPLVDNGGPTPTHELLPGSPCIDKGSNPTSLTTDQRGAGFVRVGNSATDMGAFEIQPPPPPPLIAGQTATVNEGATHRSRVTSVRVDFTQVVNLPAIPENAFQLQRQSDNGLVALTASIFNDTATHVTLTFNGALSEFGSLEDGLYTLTVFSSKVSNANGNLDGNGDGASGDDFVLVGNTATNKLFRLFGDADGNATVNSEDFAVFRSFFGIGPSFFDFQNDSQTNSDDFAEFRKRFGVTLTP